jgi:hypothetical protein
MIFKFLNITGENKMKFLKYEGAIINLKHLDYAKIEENDGQECIEISFYDSEDFFIIYKNVKENLNRLRRFILNKVILLDFDDE